MGNDFSIHDKHARFPQYDIESPPVYSRGLKINFQAKQRHKDFIFTLQEEIEHLERQLKNANKTIVQLAADKKFILERYMEDKLKFAEQEAKLRFIEINMKNKKRMNKKLKKNEENSLEKYEFELRKLKSLSDNLNMEEPVSSDFIVRTHKNNKLAQKMNVENNSNDHHQNIINARDYEGKVQNYYRKLNIAQRKNYKEKIQNKNSNSRIENTNRNLRTQKEKNNSDDHHQNIINAGDEGKVQNHYRKLNIVQPKNYKKNKNSNSRIKNTNRNLRTQKIKKKLHKD